jgi:hypothetical protein
MGIHHHGGVECDPRTLWTTSAVWIRSGQGWAFERTIR